MRLFATILLAATVVVFQGAGAATLREQLALAEENEDTLAQIELVRRILDTEPNDKDLREQLINLWLEAADYDMTEAALKEWKDAPEGFATSVRAVILYKRDEKPKEAIALLEGFHEKNPGDLDITNQLVDYYGGDRAKIVALLSSAPGVSEDAELLLSRAEAKRGVGDFQGALDDFALAEKVDPEAVKEARPSFERITVALPRVQAATERIKKDPKNFAALLERASWYTAMNADGDLVRADAKAAYEAAPESAAAALLYARTSLSPLQARDQLSVDISKQMPNADGLEQLIKLDQAIVKNPRDAKALAARSFALNDTPNQFLLALKDTDAALAIDPKNAEAHLEKIYSLIKLTRVSDAAAHVNVMEKAGVPPKKLAQAFTYLAQAEMSGNRLDSAIDYATRGLKVEPSQELYKTRAAALQRLGRTAEANADLAKAKQTKP